MNALVVSDLHLGTRFFDPNRFLAFLAEAPDADALVLNGDVVDDDRRPMPPEHERVIEELGRRSRQQRVVWIGGNHDEDYRPARPEAIEFAASCVWAGNVYISHGYEFLPMRRMLRLVSRTISPFMRALAAKPLFSVRLARRVPSFLVFLNRGTMRNAVRFAAAGGFRTIICGHMHTAFESVIGGVKYVNTGSWTDTPAHYAFVRGDEAALIEIRG